ncbi:MAG: transposase [Victivallaceae bacterium]
MDTRAGSYKRNLLTQAGKVELNVPQLRTLPFETQIIYRDKTRQSSVEEALIEMYLAGVSVAGWRTSPKPCESQIGINNTPLSAIIKLRHSRLRDSSRDGQRGDSVGALSRGLRPRSCCFSTGAAAGARC